VDGMQSVPTTLPPGTDWIPGDGIPWVCAQCWFTRVARCGRCFIAFLSRIGIVSEAEVVGAHPGGDAAQLHAHECLVRGADVRRRGDRILNQEKTMTTFAITTDNNITAFTAASRLPNEVSAKA